jgi:hypothetical protein
MASATNNSLMFTVPEYAVVTSKQRSGSEAGWAAVGKWARRGRTKGQEEVVTRRRSETSDMYEIMSLPSSIPDKGRSSGSSLAVKYFISFHFY